MQTVNPLLALFQYAQRNNLHIGSCLLHSAGSDDIRMHAVAAIELH